jgi:hypothetical protein
MDFWQNHMPAGMRLRSPWEASHISDPLRCMTLDSYYSQRHLDVHTHQQIRTTASAAGRRVEKKAVHQ